MRRFRIGWSKRRGRNVLVPKVRVSALHVTEKLKPTAHRKTRYKKDQHRVKLRSLKQKCDMSAYQTQDPFSSNFFEIVKVARQHLPGIPLVTIYYISQTQGMLFFLQNIIKRKDIYHKV